MNWIEKKFEDEQCNKSGVTVKFSLPTAAPEKNCAFSNIVFIYHGRIKLKMWLQLQMMGNQISQKTRALRKYWIYINE